MASPSRRASVDVLREALRRAVEADSLRSVAKRAGMSAMGLKAFLAGGSPQRRTEHKLRKWYVEHGASGPELSADTARICAELLMAGIPEAKRDPAVRELMGALEEIYRRKGVEPSGWTTLLQEEGSDE